MWEEDADERTSFFRRREMRPNLIPRVGEQNNNRGGDRNGGGDKNGGVDRRRNGGESFGEDERDVE